MTAPSRVLSPPTQRFRPPRFGLGGDATAATVAAAYHAGIRFFHTTPGPAEDEFRTALAQHPRGAFLLSTVVAGDQSADGVREALDASLGRLGVSSVDLVLLENPDQRTASEAYPAVRGLHEDGIVGAIGASSADWRRLDEFVTAVDLDAVLLGTGYSLLDQSAAPLLDRCEARGVAAIVADVLTPEMISVDSGQGSGQLQELAALCERHGVRVGQAALAYPSRHPAVTSVLIGATSPAEIRYDASLVRRPVPDQLWRDLAQVH